LVHYTTSCNTQSSAPEDAWDQRPKHAELIGTINKPLLLHRVGVYIIYINDARPNKCQIYISHSTLTVRTLDVYLVYVRKDRQVIEHVLCPKSDVLLKHTKVFVMKRAASLNVKINLQSIKTNHSSTKLCLIFHNSRPAIL